MHDQPRVFSLSFFFVRVGVNASRLSQMKVLHYWICLTFLSHWSLMNDGTPLRPLFSIDYSYNFLRSLSLSPPCNSCSCCMWRWKLRQMGIFAASAIESSSHKSMVDQRWWKEEEKSLIQLSPIFIAFFVSNQRGFCCWIKNFLWLNAKEFNSPSLFYWQRLTVRDFSCVAKLR